MVGHQPGQPLSDSCAEVRIEYVDYLISRNLQLVVNDWFDSLPLYEVPNKPWWAPDWGNSYRNLGSGILSINKFESLRLILLALPILIAVTGNGYFWDIDDGYHMGFSNVLLIGMAYLGLSFLAHVLYVHIANNAWPRGYFPTLSLNVAGQRQIKTHQRIVRRGRGFAREIGYATIAGVVSTFTVSGLVWIVRLVF